MDLRGSCGAPHMRLQSTRRWQSYQWRDGQLHNPNTQRASQSAVNVYKNAIKNDKGTQGPDGYLLIIVSPIHACV